jgi:c(7)-type cytochrome triheme protein
MVLLCAAVALIARLAAQQQATPPIGPEQPVAYSHKHHVGTLKLKCNMCHANKDPGEAMGLPAASVCMNCHQSVKTDSPAIQKLADYAKTNRPIRWVRVYQIPTYVQFSHRAHIEAKNTCQECHGDVASLDVMAKVVPMNMSSCMACHKEKNASNDCTFCHEQRN